MRARREDIEALLASGDADATWTLTQRAGMWTLRKDGCIVISWRGRDVPKLASFMTDWLRDKRIAAAAARSYQQQQDGGASGAAVAARSRTHSHRDEVMRLIRLCLARGEAPEERASLWAGEYPVALSTVYRWIKTARNTPA